MKKSQNKSPKNSNNLKKIIKNHFKKSQKPQKIFKNIKYQNFTFFKNLNFLKDIFSVKKKSLFLNIRNMLFNQSSLVQPNPDSKNLEKSQKICSFQKSLKLFFNAEFNAIFLVLPTEEIIL